MSQLFPSGSVALINLEIQQMLEKQAIHVVPQKNIHQGFVSSIFLVAQKGRWPEARSEPLPVQSVRPSYKHYKMGGIHMLRDLLRKGDLMVKMTGLKNR